MFYQFSIKNQCHNPKIDLTIKLKWPLNLLENGIWRSEKNAFLNQWTNVICFVVWRLTQSFNDPKFVLFTSSYPTPFRELFSSISYPMRSLYYLYLLLFVLLHNQLPLFGIPTLTSIIFLTFNVENLVLNVLAFRTTQFHVFPLQDYLVQFKSKSNFNYFPQLMSFLIP